MSGFDIGRRRVGDGSPCFIMAEVGLAHDGSLRVAHEFIAAVAKAGADAVKFQCHLGDTNDQWRPGWPERGDEKRLDYWERTGFSRDQWVGLAAHAVDRGLEFLCSPFSVEAVEMLDPLVEAWKVPSGEITNEVLLEAVDATEKPVILSSGMATMQEISEALKCFDPGRKVAVLQCTSLYPCPPEKVGLFQDWFGEKDRFRAGLSDHSGTIYAGLAAVALGCDVLEVHVKLSDHDTGPDASSSITIEKLAELVEGVRFIEAAKQPIDKDRMAEELAPMREQFMGVKA